MQVEAERRKRAAVLESEGKRFEIHFYNYQLNKNFLNLGLREASINKAEGEKRSKILVSEANQLEQINRAQGEAEALTKMAQAKAESIRLVSKALAEGVSADFYNI